MSEQDNSAANQATQATPQTVERPKSQAESESALRKLAAAFAPDEDVAPVEKQPTAGKAKGKVKPKDVKELAERLGIDVADLYTVEIPSSREGEKPFTLGALKDHMVERENFTVKSLEFEESKRTTEADMLRSQQELQTLMAALPNDAIKPEVREAARKRFGTYVQQERQKTLQAIPEWRDEKTRENEIADLSRHLGAYGFPADYLAAVQDHKLFKYFRDNMKREQQLRAALDSIKAVKTPTPARSESTTPRGNGRATVGTRRLTREEQQVQRMLDGLNRK